MPSPSKSPKSPRQKRSPKGPSYYEGLGRRKSSIARVRVFATKKGTVTIGDASHKGGTFTVNHKPLETVLTTQALQTICRKPLAVIDAVDQYVVFAQTSGGGSSSQAGAIVLGLARALAKIPSSDLHEKLRHADLLTRDPRTRERRMVGTGGKSRRIKQSPKR